MIRFMVRRTRTGIVMERVMTASLWLHVCDALEAWPLDVGLMLASMGGSAT